MAADAAAFEKLKAARQELTVRTGFSTALADERLRKPIAYRLKQSHYIRVDTHFVLHIYARHQLEHELPLIPPGVKVDAFFRQVVGSCGTNSVPRTEFKLHKPADYLKEAFETYRYARGSSPHANPTWFGAHVGKWCGAGRGSAWVPVQAAARTRPPVG